MTAWQVYASSHYTTICVDIQIYQIQKLSSLNNLLDNDNKFYCHALHKECSM